MQRVFSFEIRLECIRLYEEENLSPGAIAKKIGTVHSVVERWLKLYKYNGIEGLKIKELLTQISPEFYAKANPTFTAENLISILGKELFFQLRGNGLCKLI